MTLQEFAERIKARLAQAQQAEDEAMSAVVLEHAQYAKRVGASLAFSRAATMVDSELAGSRLRDEDQDDELSEMEDR